MSSPVSNKRPASPHDDAPPAKLQRTKKPEKNQTIWVFSVTMMTEDGDDIETDESMCRLFSTALKAKEYKRKYMTQKITQVVRARYTSEVWEKYPHTSKVCNVKTQQIKSGATDKELLASINELYYDSGKCRIDMLIRENQVDEEE